MARSRPPQRTPATPDTDERHDRLHEAPAVTLTDEAHESLQFLRETPYASPRSRRNPYRPTPLPPALSACLFLPPLYSVSKAIMLMVDLQAPPAAFPSGKKSSPATLPTHPPMTIPARQNAPPFSRTTTSVCITRKRYASHLLQSRISLRRWFY